ncbi:MAG TPA: hypothetical protein VF263_01275 [Longimicrobiaceae bacterium]
MSTRRSPVAGSLHSLAEAEPGDHLEVVYILFGSLRKRYEATGVRVGTRLRCLERTRECVRVRLPDGGTVEVEGVHAPFVEVRPLDPERTGHDRPADRGSFPLYRLPGRAAEPETQTHPKTA